MATQTRIIKILLFAVLVTTIPVRKLPRHFTLRGDQPYCALNYKTKEINCVYDSLEECRDTLQDYDMRTCILNKYKK